MNKWIPLKNHDFSKEGFYHIDTRDFCCLYSENRDFELPESKYETEDIERLLKVLNNLNESTGGEGEDWRHIVFQSEDGGWLKYIRIRIKEGKAMIFDAWQEKFNEEIDINRLDNPVKKGSYYYVIQDGEPPVKEVKPQEPVRGWGEVKEFKWKKNRNGNPYREYNKDKW